MESLNDAFEIGRIHFFFATYDVNKPEGQRQTNSVAIYLPIGEVLELCRQLNSGELKRRMKAEKEKQKTREHRGKIAKTKKAKNGLNMAVLYSTGSGWFLHTLYAAWRKNRFIKVLAVRPQKK